MDTAFLKSYQFWLLVSILGLVFVSMVFGILSYIHKGTEEGTEEGTEDPTTTYPNASILFVSKEMFI